MINKISLQHSNDLQRNVKSSLWKRVSNYKYFYIMLIPFAVYYIVFRYVPMYGIILAFKEFQYGIPMLKSPWVGFHWFIELYNTPDFWKVFKNTWIISMGRLVTGFPTPIILALMLNEIRRARVKRIFQTVYTFPHYLSWILVVGVLNGILSSDGLLNQFIILFDGQKKNFLIDPALFRPLLYITDIWKEVGWNTIIYLAALSSVNPELYEAATIDGANRFQQMRHITWPGILNTVVILLILTVGNFINNGNFDQIINMYSPSVYDVSDILDTYLYRMSFQMSANFGFTTAMGLFKAVISLVMLLSVDRLAKAFGQQGIY